MSRTVGSNGPKTAEAVRKAGLRLIFEHGYEAMSLRQLASEIGIQQGSLYNHISTKQGLLFELIRDHMLELLAALHQALDGLGDPVERLRAFVRFHVTYHLTRKQEVSVVNFELRGLEPKNYKAIIQLRNLYEDYLVSILAQGVAERRIDVADPRVAAFVILAQLTGVCTWYHPNGRLSKDAIVRIHEKMVMLGVAARTKAELVPKSKKTLRSKTKTARRR
jgi:AcrR family transcriptional regulator